MFALEDEGTVFGRYGGFGNQNSEKIVEELRTGRGDADTPVPAEPHERQLAAGAAHHFSILTFSASCVNGLTR
jgi:hypothetical protein